MEGEVCQFDKFAFCKYIIDCKRRHFQEECKDLGTCKNIKTYSKRHLRACKKSTSGHCRFDSDCSYKHQEATPNKEHIHMAQKLKQLDEVVHALARKVLGMEKETIELKQKNKTCEEKGTEVKEDISANSFNPKSSSSPKDKKKVLKLSLKK